MRTGRTRTGFSLVELLVVIAVLGVLTAAVVSVFRTHNQEFVRQQLSVAMEENLRAAIGLVKDDLRRAEYGVPSGGLTPLATWIPWVGSFITNPKLTQGSGTNPDTISIAACTSRPVGLLAATASPGTTSLNLAYQAPYTAADLNATGRRLIRVGDGQFAHVKTVSGTTVTIDVDPATSGNQGLPAGRSYFANTPICRVDVVTFDVASGRLRRNLNQGDGAVVAAEGIVDLQVAGSSVHRFRLTLSAETEQNFPGLATRPRRSLATGVTIRN